MNTNDGQLYRLNWWIHSGPLWALLINMPTISKKTTLQDVVESAVPGRETSYARKEIKSWSMPRISGGGNAESYADVSFGPFTGDVPVTHVGIATSIDESGILCLFTPIEDFVNSQEAKVFKAGEVFSVSIREEQV